MLVASDCEIHHGTDNLSRPRMRLESSSLWLGFSQLLNGTSCSVSSELFVRKKLNPYRGVWVAHNLWIRAGFRELPTQNAGAASRDSVSQDALRVT